MSSENPNPYASPTTESFVVEQDTTTDELATRGERFAGAMIDTLLFIPVFLVVFVAIEFLFAEFETEMTELQIEIFGSVLGVSVYMASLLAIHGYLLATRGQTVGKAVMKTRIVTNEGAPAPFWPLIFKRYFLVSLIGVIPGIGNFFNLANVLAIFRKNRKCLHDDMAGTKVIKLGRKPLEIGTAPVFKASGIDSPSSPGATVPTSFPELDPAPH